jgi:hypothetical protein
MIKVGFVLVPTNEYAKLPQLPDGEGRDLTACSAAIIKYCPYSELSNGYQYVISILAISQVRGFPDGTSF